MTIFNLQYLSFAQKSHVNTSNSREDHACTDQNWIEDSSLRSKDSKSTAPMRKNCCYKAQSSAIGTLARKNCLCSRTEISCSFENVR